MERTQYVNHFLGRPPEVARVSNLVDLDDPKYEKFRDIAVLPIAEIAEVEAPLSAAPSA